MLRYTLLLFLIGCLSCSVIQEENNSETELFDLLSPDETGISFSNQLTNEQLNIIDYLYYYNGGGVAVGDINNDGLNDLFFTSNEEKNHLYLNKGEMSFENVSNSAGIEGKGDWSTGVTMADVNNDGYLDIYVCYVGDYKGVTGRNELYINNQDGSFTDRAQEYNLDFVGFSTQAAFFDYDQDGDLDMYLLNHSVHSVQSYGDATRLRYQQNDKSGDKLFKNLLTETGTATFEDVTKASGIYSSVIGYGLGLATSDVNNDGWLDLYISNDFHENDYLYINNGNGTFSEKLKDWLGHTSRYSMGNDVADINADGYTDVITLDMLPKDPKILMKSVSEDRQDLSDIKLSYGYAPQYVRNMVQFNQGDHFKEVGQMMGMSATDWSWSAVIGDFDNNSNQDIFISNGIYKRPNDLDYIQYIGNLTNFRYTTSNEDSIEAEMINRMPSLRVPNQAFEFVDTLGFVDKTDQWGLEEPSYSNGAIYSDLDNDGDLDLVINNVNHPAFVYENLTNSKSTNHYLRVKLKSTENQFAIGAKAIAYFGKKLLVRELVTTRGFMSSVAPEIHIGLGQIDKVDSLKIVWPDRSVQVVKNVEADQILTIEKNNQIGISNAQSEILSYQKAKYPFDSISNFPFEHIENTSYNEFNAQPLMPYKLSAEGPALAVADVNKDGRDDVFVGGAKGQSSVLFLQKANGDFGKPESNTFNQDKFFEDVDALFFDADNDGDEDLYVASAGNEFREGHQFLQDRLYLNDGKGNFKKGINNLPNMAYNASCVKSADIDQDGDMDLFIGNISVPGNYGKSPKSYLLRNDGQGHFEVGDSLEIGMVSDAAWIQMDGSQKQSLVVVGHWMPIRLFDTSEGTFKEIERKEFESSTGWWRTVEVADIDGNGSDDIVVGNIGLNGKIRPSDQHPIMMYLGDFDRNGRNDPIIMYTAEQKLIPFASKNEIARQVPLINKTFPSYTHFAQIDGIEKLFPGYQATNTITKKAECFESVLYLQKDSSFQKRELPREAQLTSVNDILIKDLDNDGKKDLLFGGNFLNTSVNFGSLDAQAQTMLIQQPEGTFKLYGAYTRNLFKTEYRKLIELDIDGESCILAAPNDGFVIIQR